jgi:hypothetical protein
MGGFDQYIQNASTRELGDEGIKWRVILEQHIENGRKPIFPSKTTFSTATVDKATTPTNRISTSSSRPPTVSEPVPSPEVPVTSALPPAAPALYPTIKTPETSSTPDLLFAREFRKRDPNAPPRIPVFSKSLQKLFVRQNVARSIIAARNMGKRRPIPTLRN